MDRERLLDLAGRGRTVQEALARRWGLSYPSPAGGCLLTYRESADRYRNLLDLLGRLNLEDIPLIGLGRHFRLSPRAAAVVGRRREENRALAGHFRHHPPAGCSCRSRGARAAHPGPGGTRPGRSGHRRGGHCALCGSWSIRSRAGEDLDCHRRAAIQRKIDRASRPGKRRSGSGG